MTTEGGQNIERVLRTACELKAKVTILCLDSKKVCQARFTHFSRGLLSVELLDKIGEVFLKPLSQCAFVFRGGNTASVFLTLVKGICEDGFAGTLVVYEPHQLASERRSAVRIPVYRDSDPLVLVQVNGEERFAAEAIDISHTGILVEFPAKEVPEISIDTPVGIELKFDEIQVNLAGIVRRRDGSRYGIFFAKVLKGRSVEPPDDLVKLVRKLERIWLHRRAELDSTGEQR